MTMKCPLGSHCGGTYAARFSRSIARVDAAAWDAVTRGRGLFLRRDYLGALERGAGGQLSPRYAVFRDGARPVGAACYQVVDFVGRPISNMLADGAPGARFVAESLQLTGPFSVRLVVAGSAATAGDHGFAFTRGVDTDRAVRTLTRTAARVARAASSPDRRVTALLFKEFVPGANPYAEQLARYGYSALDTEANMVLRVDPRWRTFDDYLAVLSSKYRVKARRAYAKSAALQVRPLGPGDIGALEPRVSELYEAVLSRADYRIGRLGCSALGAFRQALAEDFLLQGYFLNGRLVGFLSGFVSGGRLEAHCVGIDYAQNREHAIYPRMLYDYLRIAIDRRLEVVNYGRTAAEIKSTLGAEPEPTRCYVRHRHSLVNLLLPALSANLRVPEAPLRRPFRPGARPLTAAA